jgi:hypothetical protein
MDQDSSKNKYDNSHYYEAYNIRTITQGGLSSGAIENVLGNLRRVNLLTTTLVENNNRIVGHTLMRDDLILFTTNNTGTPDAVSEDRIWKIPIATIDALAGAGSLTLDPAYVQSGGHLVYTGHLGFSTLNKIRAVARYESATVQKVYWVDGYNNLRHLNTVYNAQTNDLVNLDSDKLEVISNFSVTRPEIESFSSGNLRSGKIQYTYQLYTLNGSETAFSPASHLINLTGYSESQGSSDGYQGSALDVNTGKAVIGTIDVDATGYNRIRILAIHYTTLQGDPQIRMIEEKDISSLGEEITFVDSGQNLGSYTLEQIRLLGTFLFSAKELAIKDNILFPANITENSFDIDFDARAYRFAGASAVPNDPVNNPNYQDVAALRKRCRIYDTEDNYYEYNSNVLINPWEYYTAAGVHVVENDVADWTLIPTDFDAINKFNNIDNDGNHNFRFMYQIDGATIGGSGPHVSYKFKVKTVELDDYAGVQYIKTGPEGTADNPSYNNYASPYQCARYLGLARDEVYRYGIVFHETKGRSSFVKWIGDLRTPSISTIGNAVTYNPVGAGDTLQQDTITFNDFASGSDCRYEVLIDGDPNPTGYGYTTNESDIDDVVNAVATACASLNVTIISVDLPNDLIIIEYNSIGTHTIAIDRYIGLSLDSINYTKLTTQAYVPAVTIKSDFSPVFFDALVNKMKMNILYPEFSVDLTGTEAEDLTYQIVRVKRETNDRSIRAQGLVSGTYTSITHRYPLNWEEYDPAIWNTSFICFNSPEIAFNKNLVRQYGDKLQIAGICESDQSDFTGAIRRRKYKRITALANPMTPSGSTVAGDEFYSKNNALIDNGSIVPMDTAEMVIGNIVYHASMRDKAGTDINLDKGINMVCDLAITDWQGINSDPKFRHLVNYRRNAFNVQYGGNTYEARSRNIYMATGRVQTNNTAVIPVFDGDTYISMFDYQQAGRKLNSATGNSEVVIFPVETSINLDLRMDQCYHTNTSATYIHLIRERQGTYNDGTPGHDYIQATDLYLYNTVYSKENTAKLFMSRPFDWTSSTKFDCRILASGIKTNGELSDSWLNFGANSYIDVEPQYGELIGLININNQMLYFQPEAFGVLAINDRALIQTQSVGQLSLGTSGILERYDYKKTDTGISHRDHIVVTENGLYWVDVIKKAMYKYTSGIEEISLMKGMQSWFRTNFTGALTLSAIQLYHDPDYKEVNLVDSVRQFNLTYNEVTEAFVSFYTYYPVYIINYRDKILSTSDRLNFYKHNDLSASRCSFYGAARAASSVTLIVSPLDVDQDEDKICVFSNLNWMTEVYNLTQNIVGETFTLVRISNDYQDTGDVNLVVESNVKRRIRTWRHTIERALLDGSGDPLSRSDARIRDTYMKLKLEFNNTNIRKFVAHDITTSYMLSNK